MNDSLNPAADYRYARERFTGRGRTALPSFLREDFADALQAELLAQQDWNLVFRDNGRHYDLHPNQWRALTPEMTAQLRERVIAVGRLEFQYSYYNLPMYDMGEAGLPLPPQLQRLYELLQSEAFVTAMREVTAVEAIEFADCQATRYVDGSFLSKHDDEVQGKNRYAAYVLSLTPEWRPDWGGTLGFPGEGVEPGEFFLPRHNCLYLFKVPQPHFVSMVSPLAEGPRLSITGWLRS